MGRPSKGPLHNRGSSRRMAVEHKGPLPMVSRQLMVHMVSRLRTVSSRRMANRCMANRLPIAASSPATATSSSRRNSGLCSPGLILRHLNPGLRRRSSNSRSSRSSSSNGSREVLVLGLRSCSRCSRVLNRCRPCSSRCWGKALVLDPFRILSCSSRSCIRRACHPSRCNSSSSLARDSQVSLCSSLDKCKHKGKHRRPSLHQESKQA
mmetsp:Transcript_23324/g.36521  ORF Transcript_23324/g.36521 Transcript_23324/m.36521 type:complete len:208 (+) Transcript_23324:19-642(+)